MSIHHRKYSSGSMSANRTVSTKGAVSTKGFVSTEGAVSANGLFMNGTGALAAARDAAPETGGSMRGAGGAGQQPSPAPDNVVELHPGCRPPRTRQGMRLWGSEAGMATAEYAIATLAAVGFAGLLVFIL